jgi:hypothetical protein
MTGNRYFTALPSRVSNRHNRHKRGITGVFDENGSATRALCGGCLLDRNRL